MRTVGNLPTVKLWKVSDMCQNSIVHQIVEFRCNAFQTSSWLRFREMATNVQPLRPTQEDGLGSILSFLCHPGLSIVRGWVLFDSKLMLTRIGVNQ